MFLVLVVQGGEVGSPGPVAFCWRTEHGGGHRGTGTPCPRRLVETQDSRAMGIVVPSGFVASVPTVT